jgi:two-component system, OmpR family, response regulator
MRILVIEDDTGVADFVVSGLREAGHTVEHAADGKAGLALASAGNFDVLVVDRMLPGMDGLSIVRALRDADNSTPALILSALGEVDEKVKGLRAGADDYIGKPFAFAELIARLEAIARRPAREGSDEVTQLRVADLDVNLLSREVRRAGQVLDLQPREFRLLEYLMRNHNQVVTRTMLLENVWDYHFDPQTNVIDVHISRLRRKVDKDFSPVLIHTVRGAGYKLSESP